MKWAKDITQLDKKKEGTFRSLNGAADENIFIGRASKAGFFCFFKVWRDMPYDAVLDYNGTLYRVEVKGSSGNSFDVTRGSRSGAQIKKGPDSSRKRILSRDDCDFAVCVDSDTGCCYIVPEDIIEIIGREDLSKKTLEPFLEKWKLLMHGTNNLTPKQTRDGLRKKSLKELKKIGKKIGATPFPAEIKPKGTRKFVLSKKEDVAVYSIWAKIAEKL